MPVMLLVVVLLATHAVLFPNEGLFNTKTHSRQKHEYSTMHDQGSSGGQMKVLRLYPDGNRPASRAVLGARSQIPRYI